MPRSKSSKSSQQTKSSSPVVKADKSIFVRAKDYVIDAGKRRYGGKDAMKNIVHDIGILKTVLNTELKHVRNLQGATTCNTTTSVVGGNNSILPIAAGTDNSQRTGRSIKLHHMDLILRFDWYGGSTGVVGTQVFRWFVVLCKDLNSSNTSTAISNFLDVDPNSNYTPHSMRNIDLHDQFRVLADGVVELDMYASFTSGVNGQLTRLIPSTIPLGMHQTFSNTTSASCESNYLQIFVVGLNTGGTGTVSTVSWVSQTYFVDN